jgi:two-component system, sensor histidine kinase and response regulator
MPEHGSAPTPISAWQLGIGHLFNRIRDAVVVGDATSGRIVLWNAAAEALFGYTRDEALGLLIEDLVPLEFKTQHRLGMARYAREGRGPLIESAQLVELPGLRKNGRQVMVEFTLTPLENVDTRGRYVLAIMRDATVRIEAQRRLEEIDQMRAGFVAMVAHDVRSPMASVQGFAEHLSENWDTITPEQRAAMLAAIERAAGKVVRLAEDILDTAALETGNVPIDLEPVSVADAIDGARESFDATGAASRFQVSVESDIYVLADRHRLWQVLSNVFGNAIKHSPQGSPIEVEARSAEGVVVICVRDHGPGIADADRERVFEPFTQAGADPATGSVGLGLYVARQLLELMDGEIVVHQPLTGPGAILEIKLPASPRS